MYNLTLRKVNAYSSHSTNIFRSLDKWTYHVIEMELEKTESEIQHNQVLPDLEKVTLLL